MIEISFPLVSWSRSGQMSFRVRCVMLQKRKRIHAALISALMIFTIMATCEGSLANWLNRLAVSMKKGAPGGCPTSSLYPVVINSGQSQKLAVGSMVMQ
jgi:hypothetical protein